MGIYFNAATTLTQHSSTDQPTPLAKTELPKLLSELKVLSRGEHQISRKQLSPNALKVLYRLNEADFKSFIVGGGVRDTLLGLKPKDFDIATDATPEEVKALFRNSRIIGRRFRIVHVQFGREIIEVSTFRAKAPDSTEIKGDSLARKVRHLDSAHSQGGMLLRDNVYGDIEGDVMRRDFTVNALYYTVQNFEVHDYLNGIEDLEKRVLRIIGDPLQRYKEDPVRILRAIRLSAKLDFTLAKSTEAPLSSCAELLSSIPPARLFDEFLKLFFSGKGVPTYKLLCKYGVFNVLFPGTSAILQATQQPTHYQPETLLESAFQSTDQRILQGKSVTPAFLLAAILWPVVDIAYRKNLASNIPSMPAMHEAAQTTLTQQLDRLAIPKRFSIPMREIWDYQLRLPKRGGKRAEALVQHKRFRAAYDFILLREQSGEDLDGLGQWWTTYQSANQSERIEMQTQQLRYRNNSRSGKRKVKSAKKK